MPGTELSPEEVLSQLKTRGFEAGFARTPLREFTGRLDSITGTLEQRGQATEARLYVLYNFSELNVIESTEPYTSPVAQIEIPHSDRVQSQMGVFGKSADAIINEGVPEDAEADEIKGQDFLVGKILHMKYTGGHMMWDGREKKVVARDCWELVGIMEDEEPVEEPRKPVAKAKAPAKTAGKPVAKASSNQKAIDLLDGKTEQEFYSEVFNNESIKSDGNLVSKIINRQFIEPLVQAGIVELDEEGIYHKV